MLLQNPKIRTKPASALTINDYQKYHRVYVRSYKRLHEEVSAFSVLPEKFVEQVEPAIEKYLVAYADSARSETQTEFLQVLTDFITRFHSFMNEATEMFTEHQLLSDDTYAYLQKVGQINTRQPVGEPAFNEKDFIALIPELEHLCTSLAAVKAIVRSTAEHLRSLEPYWLEIKSKIGTGSATPLPNCCTRVDYQFICLTAHWLLATMVLTRVPRPIHISSPFYNLRHVINLPQNET